ncbi:uncharacterized protein LOC129579899 [Sitodiplosis mosellana]|uniref:uncharacterized protein LOC129579899 n=1 Tax=Sitodiplosis mosellana TaxID=263140 RepID=UPI00244380FE|nr:uncharacterized protein LOC129579899 [Sitodiplosis mosellana]
MECGDEDIGDCIQQYSDLGKCCGEIICDQLDTLKTCEMEGTTYRLNEVMELQNDECYTCLCTEDFDISIIPSENPNCEEIKCVSAIDFFSDIQSGCVPIIHRRNCCPYEVKCPNSKKDAIDLSSRSKEEKEEKEDAVCKFGDLTLKRNEILVPDNQNDYVVECSCKMPPILTCIGYEKI